MDLTCMADCPPTFFGLLAGFAILTGVGLLLVARRGAVLYGLLLVALAASGIGYDSWASESPRLVYGAAGTIVLLASWLKAAANPEPSWFIRATRPIGARLRRLSNATDALGCGLVIMTIVAGALLWLVRAIAGLF